MNERIEHRAWSKAHSEKDVLAYAIREKHFDLNINSPNEEIRKVHG